MFLLRPHLRGRPCRVFSTEVELRVAKSNAYYYPDVVVVCGASAAVAGERQTAGDPLLVVEVPSPSTEAIDRREKLAAYRSPASLQEYAPVSQGRQQVEIYRRQGDIGWLYVAYEPGDEVGFASLGFPVPMPAIHEGTDVGA